MVHSRSAVHRTVVVVDVEAFGDRRRNNSHQVTVRDGLYRILEEAFRAADIPWNQCRREDRGDGVFILAPAEVAKACFVEALPSALIEELRRHNDGRSYEERIRLRMALHAGEVNLDQHGATGASVNLTFRLVDSPPLKSALSKSSGVMALIVSSWFFDEVVRHSPCATPSNYRQVRITSKETDTVGWICLPDNPYPPGPVPAQSLMPTPPRPRQLPAHTPHFVGRTDEMQQLTALLDTTGTVAIAVINGPPGIGKTALAVRWAHQVVDQFVDGQLYVDLRGFHPSMEPMQPAEAIRGFLEAFEIPAERIPSRYDAQVAFYRSVLTERRVLVILDNAHNAEQVRALLPGSATCMVVVTSRDQLVELITWEGAHPVNLNAFSVEEGIALLARRIGQQRVTTNTAGVANLIEKCAGLPLALAIVAARVELNPSLTIDMLADQLADVPATFDVLDDLRIVLTWSYQQLDANVARMFRLLSLHPGPEFSIAAAASLVGIPADDARAALTALTRAHLLTEPIPGRFAFHDLLRAYAARKASEIDANHIHHAANHRLLDHYVHTGFIAITHLDTSPQDVTPDGPPQPGVTLSIIQNYQQAVRWFASEHRTVLVIIRYAHYKDFNAYAWKLAWMYAGFAIWAGCWEGWDTIEQCALAAADHLDNNHARRRINLVVAIAKVHLGHSIGALAHARKSLDLSIGAGDSFGEALSHFALAMAYGDLQQESEALSHSRLAKSLFDTVNNMHWRAGSQHLQAWLCGRFGEHREAVKHCMQALDVLNQIGDPQYHRAQIESVLAWNQSQCGNYPEAIAHYNRSITLYRSLADYGSVADAMRYLGDAHLAMGDSRTALEIWQKAAEILDSLNLPHTGINRDKLSKRINENPI